MTRYLIPIIKQYHPLLKSLGFTKCRLRHCYTANSMVNASKGSLQSLCIVNNALSKRLYKMTESEYDDYLNFALWCALRQAEDSEQGELLTEAL